MSCVTVTVRLFAMLRQRAGRDVLELELATGATVADALEALRDVDDLGQLLERMPVRAAVNREYVSAEAPLASGDELALIPPVSGGAAPGLSSYDVHVRVTDEPLSLEAIAGAVGRPEAGAIVTFQGTTREVDRLEYEAYTEMAELRIAAILRECADHHGLEAAAAEHRIGAVPLGQPSVIVAVSAAHRAEAFAGAREAIDRIKNEVPVWKREVRVGERGATRRWVEGALPPSSEPAHRVQGPR